MGVDVHAATEVSRDPRTTSINHLSRLRLPYTRGPLSADELAQYWEQGFLVKQGVIDEKLLCAAKEAIDAEVDALAEALHKAEKIRDPCREEGFETRLACIEKQYPSASVLLHKRGVLPPAFSELWASRELTAIVR